MSGSASSRRDWSNTTGSHLVGFEWKGRPMQTKSVVLFVPLLLLLVGAAAAQDTISGSIVGTVRDSSGGALPGVSVEASSPALIERTRTVVTDSQGRYRIIDLRPGTYTVTFSLPAFVTLRREGIELTTGFAATVNAELAIGAVSETITVSGAAPTVDVSNTTQQLVLSREIIQSLPVGKN